MKSADLRVISDVKIVFPQPVLFLLIKVSIIPYGKGYRTFFEDMIEDFIEDPVERRWLAETVRGGAAHPCRTAQAEQLDATSTNSWIDNFRSSVQ